MLFRYLAAAATPLSPIEVLGCVFETETRSQTNSLQTTLSQYLDTSHVYTYESLMRTTYACLAELRQHSAKKKIIIPRYLCPSFTHGILAAGLEIVYCDLDPDTLNIDLVSLKKINTKDVLALLCPNLFGLCNPMDKLQAYCSRHGITLIEGADYTLGAEFNHQKLGTFGDYTILNFQEGKALPIGGGAVTTNHSFPTKASDNKRPQRPANWPIMLAYSVLTHPFPYAMLTHGLNLLGIDKKKLSMEDTIRQTHSETDFQWSDENLRALSTFQSRLGTKVLSHLSTTTQARLENALIIEANLAYSSKVSIIPRHPKLNAPHYLRYPVLVKKPRKREQHLAELAQAGIEASPMYSEHGMSIDKREYPGAYQVAISILTLPCHPYVTKSDITTMTALLT